MTTEVLSPKVYTGTLFKNLVAIITQNFPKSQGNRASYPPSCFLEQKSQKRLFFFYLKENDCKFCVW